MREKKGLGHAFLIVLSVVGGLGFITWAGAEFVLGVQAAINYFR